MRGIILYFKYLPKVRFVPRVGMSDKQFCAGSLNYSLYHLHTLSSSTMLHSHDNSGNFPLFQGLRLIYIVCNLCTLLTKPMYRLAIITETVAELRLRVIYQKTMIIPEGRFR